MTQNFGDYLRDLRTRKNYSVTELARLTGVSPSYISQIENGKRGAPQPRILNKLSTNLGISKYELLVKCGYLDLNDPIIDTDGTIKRILASLTEAKKQLLLFLDAYDEETIHCLVNILRMFTKKK